MTIVLDLRHFTDQDFLEAQARLAKALYGGPIPGGPLETYRDVPEAIRQDLIDLAKDCLSMVGWEDGLPFEDNGAVAEARKDELTELVRGTDLALHDPARFLLSCIEAEAGDYWDCDWFWSEVNA